MTAEKMFYDEKCSLDVIQEKLLMDRSHVIELLDSYAESKDYPKFNKVIEYCDGLCVLDDEYYVDMVYDGVYFTFQLCENCDILMVHPADFRLDRGGGGLVFTDLDGNFFHLIRQETIEFGA